MKKIFLIAGLAGFVSLGVQAQVMPERKNDGVNKEYRTAKRGDVYKDLNLSADQQAKLKALNEESRAQMTAIRNNNSLTQDQKKAKFEEFRQGQKAKRDAIFTTEQKAKMNAKMEQMKKERKGNGNWKDGGNKKGMRKGAGTGTKEGWKRGNGTAKDANGLSRRGGSQRGNLMQELNLTADQKTKMENLNSEMRTKMQVIRDNSSLNQEQKRSAMQDLVKETQLKRKGILTVDQQAKWEAREKQTRDARPDVRRGINRTT